MKLLYSILIVLFSLTLQACAHTSVHSTAQDHNDSELPEFVVVPAASDTMPVSPTTNYFYRYVFEDIQQWDMTPEWGLANLSHLGINVVEAWYHGSSNHTGGDNGGPIGWTMVAPSFVVGLARDNPEILRHHFEQANKDDLIALLKSSRIRMIHYVQKIYK